MRASEEQTDFHDDIAHRVLWCEVIKQAVAEARAGSANAQHWFSTNVWKTVSAMLLTIDEIRVIEQEALSGKAPSNDDARYNKRAWSENPKAVAERERYRKEREAQLLQRQQQVAANKELRERARLESAAERMLQPKVKAPKRVAMTPEVRKERDRDRCREKKRAATNYYERREPGFVQPARKQDDPTWHATRAETKRTASRERYRLKVGFYDRQPATAAVCDGA